MGRVETAELGNVCVQLQNCMQTYLALRKRERRTVVINLLLLYDYK